MHAVLIRFDAEVEAPNLRAPFTEYATALRHQPGLISKAWIVTDSGYGGFHLFTTRDAAATYLSSDLAAGLMATDGFDNFIVDQFDVLDELSAMTGVTVAALSGA